MRKGRWNSRQEGDPYPDPAALDDADTLILPVTQQGREGTDRRTYETRGPSGHGVSGGGERWDTAMASHTPRPPPGREAWGVGSDADSEGARGPAQGSKLMRVEEFLRLARMHRGPATDAGSGPSPCASPSPQRPATAAAPTGQDRGALGNKRSMRPGRPYLPNRGRREDTNKRYRRRNLELQGPWSRLQDQLKFAGQAVANAFTRDVFNRDLPSNLHETGKAEELHEEHMRVKKEKEALEKKIGEEKKAIEEGWKLFHKAQELVAERLRASVNAHEGVGRAQDPSIYRKAHRLRDDHSALMQLREAVRQKTAEVEKVEEEHEILSRRNRSVYVSALEAKVKVFMSEVETLRKEYDAVMQKFARKERGNLLDVQEQLEEVATQLDQLEVQRKKEEEEVGYLTRNLKEAEEKWRELQQVAKEVTVKHSEVEDELRRDPFGAEGVIELRKQISKLHLENSSWEAKLQTEQRRVDEDCRRLEDEIGYIEMKLEGSKTKFSTNAEHLERTKEECEKEKERLERMEASRKTEMDELESIRGKLADDIDAFELSVQQGKMGQDERKRAHDELCGRLHDFVNQHQGPEGHA